MPPNILYTSPLNFVVKFRACLYIKSVMRRLALLTLYNHLQRRRVRHAIKGIRATRTKKSCWVFVIRLFCFKFVIISLSCREVWGRVVFHSTLGRLWTCNYAWPINKRWWINAAPTNGPKHFLPKNMEQHQVLGKMSEFSLPRGAFLVHCFFKHGGFKRNAWHLHHRSLKLLGTSFRIKLS